jgi:RNA polymerase sigma-70 factor (ECF subfamily)
MDQRSASGWIGPRHGIMAAGRSAASAAGGSHDTGRATIETDPAFLAPPDSVVDERAIVAAVLDGDRDAFRRLVERESANLVRACHRILGNQAEAEDAAQEAFVTAFRSLASWRGDGPFGAWLARIGVRIALRQASRRRVVPWRDPARPDTLADGLDPADRAAERAAVAAAPLTDPAMLSLRAERATEVRTAVAALPEPYREVVALHFFGEASLQEIAHETGRPLGTVKTHLHRGLERLRTRLEGGTR